MANHRNHTLSDLFQFELSSHDQTRVSDEIIQHKRNGETMDGTAELETDLCRSGWRHPWSVHPQCAWWRDDPLGPAVMHPSPPQRPGQSAPHSGWNVPEKHSWVKALLTSHINNKLFDSSDKVKYDMTNLYWSLWGRWVNAAANIDGIQQRRQNSSERKIWL